MQDIHPIKPALNLSLWDTPLPALIVLATISLLAAYLLKRSSRRLEATHNTREEPMDSYALIDKFAEELNRADRLLREGRVYDYALIASDIIKRAISERYQTQIRELTTDEISRKRGVPKHVIQAAIRFLHAADMEKFSRNKEANADADILRRRAHETIASLRMTTSPTNSTFSQQS